MQPSFDPFSVQNAQGGNPPTVQGPQAQPQQQMQIPQQQAPSPVPQAQPQPQPASQPNAQPTGTADKNQTPPPRNPNSTQNSLQFSELRDGMIIMKDGSFRAVVACRSINFDLMSDREREGVEYSYQNFLNSLNFPVQILVRSRRVDIGPYIQKLSDIRYSQDNMLLGVLMDDYIDFIDALAQEANIMEKSFYVVVPYFVEGDLSNIVDQGKGFFGKLFARPGPAVTNIDSATYQKAKSEIKNRVDVVLAGLFQIGVQGVQLDTKLLGELLYSAYNPDTALRQPINNFDDLATTYVKKGDNNSSATGGVQ